MRARSRLWVPLLAIAFVVSSVVSPAVAAGSDSWVKWDAGDHWVRSLDYATPTNLIAGSEGDGVFASSNAVGPWSNITGNLTTTGKQVHQAVGLSGQIYLATSAGLFKGSGGGSWSQLGVDDSTPAAKRLDGGGVQTIVFPSGTATNMVVGTAGSGDVGVFYSSDSGKTWTEATGLTTATFFISGTSAVLYAAASSGFYRSTDGGKSWTLSSDGVPPGETPLRIQASPASPNQLIGATTGGIYRSDNAGLTWYDASGSGATALNGGTVRAFQLAPQSFWTGSVPRFLAGSSQGVWASVDGGDKWAKMSEDKVGNPDGIDMGDEIVWALNIGFGTPGSLIAGTQGHGVFALPLTTVSNTSAPTISGTAQVNQVITASPGVWAGTGPFFFLYQWKRCTDTTTGSCSNISGATSPTYQVVSDDFDKYLRVGVKAINLVSPAYTAEVLSGPFGKIVNQPGFEPQPPPGGYPKLVNGTSAPWGATMSIDTGGDWRSNGVTKPTTFTYRWYRCNSAGSGCVLIPTATGASYTTTTDDVDRRIEARVIGTIEGASSPERLANISGLVYEQKPVNVGAPKVVGNPLVGVVLQSTAGAWTGHNPTFTRRWLRCNSDGLQCQPTNPVVTTSTYKLAAGDLGSRFRIEVTATVTDSSQNRVTTVLSAPTAVVKNPTVCADLKQKISKAKKAVKAATKALKRAKASGNQAKITKAKKKLKRAKKKLRKLKALYKAYDC